MCLWVMIVDKEIGIYYLISLSGYVGEIILLLYKEGKIMIKLNIE